MSASYSPPAAASGPRAIACTSSGGCSAPSATFSSTAGMLSHTPKLSSRNVRWRLSGAPE